MKNRLIGRGYRRNNIVRGLLEGPGDCDCFFYSIDCETIYN